MQCEYNVWIRKANPNISLLDPKSGYDSAGRDYNEGSGYGSVSRTVEEIILAFDSVYKAFRHTRIPDTGNKPLKDSDKATFFIVLTSILQNIENSISRLKPSSESNQEVNQWKLYVQFVMSKALATERE